MMKMRTPVVPFQSHDSGLLELQEDELSVTIALEAISTAMRAAWFGRLVVHRYESGTEQSLPLAGEMLHVPSTELLKSARSRGTGDQSLSSSAVFCVLKFYMELSDAGCACGSQNPRSTLIGLGLKPGRTVSLKQWQRVAAVGVQMLDELKHCIGHLLPKPIGDILTSVTDELVLVRDSDDMSTVTTATNRTDREQNRRRMKRYSLKIPALLSCEGESRNVVVIDISIVGLGLSSVENIKRGDHIVVWLNTRRELRGTIAWVRDERAGMTFDTPLPSNDSLLIGQR